MRTVQMKNKLLAAWCIFSFVCGRKLEKEQRRGRIGWDDRSNKEEWEERIRTLASKKLTLSRLVNISNYCDFLWNMEKERRKNEIY